MTPEQKAAYVFAQAACMLAEMEGMKACNQQRAHRKESIAYHEGDFFGLPDKFGIGHNDTVGLFHGD